MAPHRRRRLPSALPFAVAAMLFTGAARADDGGRRAEGFGLGLGSATIANGISMKYFMGGTALQGVVGVWGGGGWNHRFGHADGLAAAVDYLFEMPSLARAPYFTLDWSFGLGAGFGVDAFAHGSPRLAGSGVAGLEFNFTRIPLDVVVEYRPTLEILQDVGLRLVDFTGHVRFYF